MKNKKISIDEFVKIAGVKLSTIKRNSSRIPGLIYKDGSFDILKGTRYPGDFHRYKMKNSAEKRFILLKAISDYKYIDHLKLKLYKEQFDELLIELLDAELIRENHLYNNYGANAYDCTPKGDEILSKKKNGSIEELTKVVASATGHFVGAVISEIAPQ